KWEAGTEKSKRPVPPVQPRGAGEEVPRLPASQVGGLNGEVPVVGDPQRLMRHDRGVRRDRCRRSEEGIPAPSGRFGPPLKGAERGGRGVRVTSNPRARKLVV